MTYFVCVQLFDLILFFFQIDLLNKISDQDAEIRSMNEELQALREEMNRLKRQYEDDDNKGDKNINEDKMSSDHPFSSNASTTGSHFI